MIKYYSGDLLKAKSDIICHQVNLQGVMGGGIALQISQRFPNCEIQYQEYVKSVGNENLSGKVFFYQDKNVVIANCFSQDANFNTNYDWIKCCFTEIKRVALDNRFKTIGVPKNYGCGIANGDWNKVLNIFQSLFEYEDIELQVYEFDKKG